MKIKLRIALVSESFCYPSGVGVVLQMLIKLLKTMNTEIVLIGPRHHNSEKWHVDKCVWLPSKTMKSRGYSRTEIRAPRNNELIIEALSGVDIVFCESISILVLRVIMLRRAGKINSKIVFHAHTMADKYLSSWYGLLACPLNLFIIKPITWFCLNTADLRMAPSLFFSDHLTKMQWCKKPIVIWPAPINIPALPDVSRIRAGQMVARFKSKHEFVLVANGRIGNEKRSLDLIKLTLCLRKKGIDAGLVFVGGGEIEFFNRKISIPDKQHFLFTDVLPREEGIAINKLCDVGIAIAVTDTESLSFLEQMAMGLPMIAQDNTVMASYVREADCGLVMPDAGLDDMTSSLAAFLMEKNLFISYGRKAKEYVERLFSEEKQFKELAKIIEDLLVE